MRARAVLLLLALPGCQGLVTSTGGNPPDPSIAASATWGVQSVNDDYPSAVNLDTVTGVALTDRGPGADRRIYYDHFADRWFTVSLALLAGTPPAVYVSASSGPDPSGVWYPYTYLLSSAADQPSMGFAQNIAIIADRISHTVLANTITNLEYGVGDNPWSFATPTGSVYSYAARSRDGDLAFNYVVSDGQNQSSVFIQRLAADLTLRSVQIGTGPFGSGGIRVGALNLGSLYAITQSPHDVYVGAGGHHLYVLVDIPNGADSCLRILDFYDVAASPFAPTLQGHTDYCLAGADVWQGSIAQNIDGTIYLVAHCSGPSMPISMCYAVLGGGMVIKKAGTVFSTVSRVGDYATATPYWRDGGHRILATTEIGLPQAQAYDGETWVDLIP